MTTEFMRTQEEIAERADALAGNWESFESFSWWGRDDDAIPDPENWAVVYTRHRDSTIMEESNAAAIEKILAKHEDGDSPAVVSCRHSHWACGHLDGYAIRVFNPDGSVTQAALDWFDIADSLEQYPILDESDYSDREYDESISNFSLAASGVRHDYELPEGWESEVFSWLWDSIEWQHECESRDDQGAWPSEEAFEAAFTALGYEFTGDA